MKIALAALIALSPLPASALEFSTPLVLDLGGDLQRETITYQCEGRDAPLTVTYINAHPEFLALVGLGDGSPEVFVNVIAASGARYAAGQMVWWTRGNEAQLIDETAEDGAEPVSCHAADNIP